jgi:hypothetical protein
MTGRIHWTGGWAVHRAGLNTALTKRKTAASVEYRTRSFDCSCCTASSVFVSSYSSCHVLRDQIMWLVPASKFTSHSPLGFSLDTLYAYNLMSSHQPSFSRSVYTALLALQTILSTWKFLTHNSGLNLCLTLHIQPSASEFSPMLLLSVCRSVPTRYFCII